MGLFRSAMIVWQDELQAILYALVGGARYGVKIRFPHALVMTSLFRTDLNAPQKLKLVLQLVKEHTKNLAAFVALYKTVLFILKLLSHYHANHMTTDSDSSLYLFSFIQRCYRMVFSLLVSGKMAPLKTDPSLNAKTMITISTAAPGYPQCPHHAMIAGLIGGYCVWGNYSSINYQIVLYLASRVFVAVVKRLIINPKGLPPSGDGSITIPLMKDRTYSFCAAMIWGIVLFLYEDSPEVLHPSLRTSMDEIYRFRPWSSLIPKARENLK